MNTLHNEYLVRTLVADRLEEARSRHRIPRRGTAPAARRLARTRRFRSS